MINGGLRNNVVHKQNGGATLNAHTFSFNWTAPASSVGDIKFYAAGNASDNNNDSLHDYIYITNHLVTLSTVGLEEKNANEFVSIYPNPANESAIISLQLTENNVGEISLYNIAGEKVFETNIQTQTTNLKLKTSSYKQGTYFLKATVGDKTVVRKILIYH